jgi:hypothetical protein
VVENASAAAGEDDAELPTSGGGYERKSPRPHSTYRELAASSMLSSH